MKRARGFTLLEILIAMVIIAVGLLGIAALQSHASRAEVESYQRAQALLLVGDMLNRVEANHQQYAYECYAGANAPNQAGTGQPGQYACNVSTNELAGIATADLVQWDALLKGAAESSGVGAMINAYGCITFDGVDTVTVGVYWQGLTATSDAALPAQCTSAPAYGTGMRRGVSRSVRFPNLTPAGT